MNSLIIYSTTDGQTKKICETIKNNSIYKKSTEIVNLNEAFKKKIVKYDRVIIGASIRYGQHNPMVYRFIEKNKDALENRKSAFFSVNVVARKPEKSTPKTNPYIKKFLKNTDWRPNKLGVFAGKIDYPSLSLLNKSIIRLIMFITGGPTDIRNVYEFTNWEGVKIFSQELDEM